MAASWHSSVYIGESSCVKRLRNLLQGTSLFNFGSWEVPIFVVCKLENQKKNTKYSFNQSLVVWASSQPFFTKVPDWGNNWHSTIIKQARSHLTLPVIYCLHWSSKNWCSNKFVSQEVVLIRAEGRHWVKG